MDEATALSLVMDNYDGQDYESVVEGVDDGHVKHDTTAYYSIFLRKSDLTYWRVNYQSSYNYGLDEYNIYTYQVEKKEVTLIDWVPKK